MRHCRTILTFCRNHCPALSGVFGIYSRKFAVHVGIAETTVPLKAGDQIVLIDRKSDSGLIAEPGAA
ncbi:MAG: hypothetical protein LBE85_12555 [Candidatus Accumulibacter sp.]|jgi:hypothetical protein|nr:hypothetical protein [Accumulibacter sp.]